MRLWILFNLSVSGGFPWHVRAREGAGTLPYYWQVGVEVSFIHLTSDPEERGWVPHCCWVGGSSKYPSDPGWKVRSTPLLFPTWLQLTPGGSVCVYVRVLMTTGWWSESWLSPHFLHHNPAGRGVTLSVGIEIQARQVSGCLAIIYQRGAQAPYLAFAGMSGVGPQGFFCFVCGVLLEWLLSESFLSCWTVPFLVLWLQTAGFCWSFALFFPPVQIGISELSASSIVSLRYLRLKENQATYHWMSFLGLKFP